MQISQAEPVTWATSVKINKSWSWHCQNTRLEKCRVTFNWLPSTHCSTAWFPRSLQGLGCKYWRTGSWRANPLRNDTWSDQDAVLCNSVGQFFQKTAHNMLWHNSEEEIKWVPINCACSNLLIFVVIAFIMLHHNHPFWLTFLTWVLITPWNVILVSHCCDTSKQEVRMRPKKQLIVHLTLLCYTFVTSYLPLFSRLAWHVCCWEASKAVFHGRPYNRTPSLTWGRLTGHCHLVLRVAVQVVIVRIQGRLVKTAVVGGVYNQIRRALQVPSAGDGRDVLNEHPSLWKEKKNKI